MRRPDGLLFDLGDTILLEPPLDLAAGEAALLRAATDTNGATVQAVSARAAHLWEDLRARVEASCIEIGSTSFRRLLHDFFGVRFDRTAAELERIFWEAAYPRFPPAAGIGEALVRVRAAGLPMGIVSNCTFREEVIAWELAQAGLDGFFRFLMTSADYGLRKPHPEIFRTAAARLGIAPERVWFLGDRPDKDVAGAKAAGMAAIWYNPHGRPCEGSVRPDAEIRHWDELGALL